VVPTSHGGKQARLPSGATPHTPSTVWVPAQPLSQPCVQNPSELWGIRSSVRFMQNPDLQSLVVSQSSKKPAPRGGVPPLLEQAVHDRIATTHQPPRDSAIRDPPDRHRIRSSWYKPRAVRSDAIKKGIDRAPARAMLKATGLNNADLDKPLIAVANTWTDATPCNLHLRDLAAHVKEGIRHAGGTPIEFNTIVVSDGISMGTEGMRASLVSREVIADSIELAVRGAMCDGVVALSGCDKTIPATMMALAPAAGSSPPTPCRWPARCWGFRPWG
jgi:hypothetical protein